MAQELRSLKWALETKIHTCRRLIWTTFIITWNEQVANKGSGRTIPGIPCIGVMWDSCLDSFPYVYQVSIEAYSKMRRKCHIHYEGFLDLSIKNDTSPSTYPACPQQKIHIYVYTFLPPVPYPYTPPSSLPLSLHLSLYPMNSYSGLLCVPSSITFGEHTVNKTVSVPLEVT